MSKNKHITLRFDDDIVDQFNTLSAARNVSRAELIRRAIAFGLPFVRHDHILNPSRIAVLTEIAYAVAETFLDELAGDKKNEILRIAEERFIRFHKDAA